MLLTLGLCGDHVSEHCLVVVEAFLNYHVALVVLVNFAKSDFVVGDLLERGDFADGRVLQRLVNLQPLAGVALDDLGCGVYFLECLV